ncbi:cell division protein FtsL [Rhodococcus sp. ARC_M5]|nr:cell division protein FtsL [Rhodococcus sp. ARC_M5]
MMARRGRSGTSPGGRDPRPRGRSSSSSRSKAGGVSRDGNASGRQATPPEPSEQVRDAVVGGKAAPRRVGARRPKMPERTFFGLSTGRAVVLGVVVCALALTLAVPLRTYFSQRSELESVLAERAALEKDVEALRVQKSQLDEPSRIAADARERLRFVMPGETPYQVQLPGDYSPSSEDLAVDDTPTGPWFTELWNTAVEPQGSDEPQEPTSAPMPLVQPEPAPAPPPVPEPEGGPVG